MVGEAQIIERAALNLLDNAAKWSPPGGTVTIDLDRGELTVSDEGPGIAEADLPLIFERFYRASDARTMPGPGPGLSIVRQAAERHGGSVRVRNRLPHGAVFTMTLPGSPYRPAPPPRRTLLPEQGMGTTRPPGNGGMSAGVATEGRDTPVERVDHIGRTPS